jgi:arginine deiminase
MDYRLGTWRRAARGGLMPGSKSPAQAASAASELYGCLRSPTFFQRDPLVVVGERSVRGAMATAARLREPLLSGYVMSLHPRFANPEGGKFWFQEFSADYAKPSSYARMRPTLEGGDVLVLREDLLAIGYSERTEKTTIERLAESFKKLKSPIKRILVVAIPPMRSFMHLDTVFTMISQDECLVYGPMILPDGAEEADVYECDLTKREITWTTEKDMLSALKAQKLDLKPIRCGGQDPIAERREQWTDGANAFALAPGVVLIYDRNEPRPPSWAAGCTVSTSRPAVGQGGAGALEAQQDTSSCSRPTSLARGGPRHDMPLVRAKP